MNQISASTVPNLCLYLWMDNDPVTIGNAVIYMIVHIDRSSSYNNMTGIV